MAVRDLPVLAARTEWYGCHRRSPCATLLRFRIGSPRFSPLGAVQLVANGKHDRRHTKSAHIRFVSWNATAVTNQSTFTSTSRLPSRNLVHGISLSRYFGGLHFFDILFSCVEASRYRQGFLKGIKDPYSCVLSHPTRDCRGASYPGSLH